MLSAITICFCYPIAKKLDLTNVRNFKVFLDNENENLIEGENLDGVNNGDKELEGQRKNDDGGDSGNSDDDSKFKKGKPKNDFNYLEHINGNVDYPESGIGSEELEESKVPSGVNVGSVNSN